MWAGFGQMLARPLFRERHRPDMSEEEATTLLHDALRVRPACRQLCTLTLLVFCRLPGLPNSSGQHSIWVPLQAFLC